MFDQYTLFPDRLEEIRDDLKSELTDREFAVIDSVLFTIRRNRQIRLEFKTLKSEATAKDVISYLAKKYSLSDAYIDFIVYPRNLNEV